MKHRTRPDKYEMKTCPACNEVTMIGKKSTYCSHRCASLGNDYGKHQSRGAEHHQWKGDSAGYASLHERLYRVFGKAKEHVCIGCGHPAAEWANLTGHYTDINDYQALCHSCHKKYDAARRRKLSAPLAMSPQELWMEHRGWSA